MKCNRSIGRLYLPEYWCQEYTNIADMNWNIERMQNPMNAARCDHKTRINGTANNTAQWIPGPIVKPIQEVIEAFFDHKSGRSVIEPLYHNNRYKI